MRFYDREKEIAEVFLWKICSFFANKTISSQHKYINKMVKLKANVKKVVEIFGQSDIRILTLHPKVVWKTCVMLKKVV